jgi:hypothetical protein
MALWSLSTQYKKSSVEKMFFYNDGKVITIEQGFRWATFTVESDERPLTDEELINKDGYELSCIANDESWEMSEMIDGCWCDIEIANDKATEEDLEAFIEAWEEDSYDGVEALGWSNDDTEYYYYGPLMLVNDDTGEEFLGDTPEPQEKTEEQLKAELDDLIATMPEVPEEEPEVTDWFPADVKPAHKGTYQAITAAAPMWPFPSMVEWDGKKWSEDVKEWRGLANEPKASWPF